MANRKLTKVKRGAKVSGVCMGLSQYFGIDVVYIRLIFVLAFFFGWGTPVLIYIALAIVLPEHDPDAVDYDDVFDDAEEVSYTSTSQSTSQSTSHKFTDEYDDSSRYERGEERYARNDEDTYRKDE